MPKNYNKDVVNAFIAGTNAQSASQEIPQEVGKTIVPTLDITPRNHRVCNVMENGTRTVTADANLYAVPSDKYFYLVSANTSFIKDVVCDQATGAAVYLKVNVGGATKIICNLPSITLTADKQAMTMYFNPPIKVDSGSTIVLSGGGYAAGVMSRVGGVIGYTIDKT